MKQVALALVVTLGGCSMAFQSHLPDRPNSGPPTAAQVAECSTSHTLPWVDVAIAGAELVASAVVIATADSDAQKSIGMGLIGAGFMQGVSGGNGFKRASACARAKQGAAPMTAMSF